MTLCYSHKKEDPFARIDKKLIYDPSISWKAKGILLYAFSRPTDWKFYRSEMITHSSDGERSFDSGIQELEKAGYLHKITKHKEDGRLDGWDYHFFEEPISEEEFKKFHRNLQNAEIGITPKAAKCNTTKKDSYTKKNNNNKGAAPRPADPPPVVVVDSQAKGKELDLLKQRLSKAQAVLKLAPAAMEVIPRHYRLYELLYALEEFNAKAKVYTPKNPAGAFVSTLKNSKKLLDSMPLNEREMHLTSLGYVFVLDNIGNYWIKWSLI